MAKTFEEIVEMQRAASEAKTKAAGLREMYGPPTAAPWSKRQSDLYETALRAWRDLDRDLQIAISAYAKEHGRTHSDVESEARAQAGVPEEDA
ncbi:hypothetical protein ACIQ6V_16295 [Streptomyces sp. NPDC096198]|uniref:hypothetical protein n=1 Tax=Streptomyces sp. NPDC096198 TaxID=3366080 RepID=UPI0037FACA4D